MATVGQRPESGPKASKSTLFFVFHLHIFGSLMMLQNVSESLFFSTLGVELLPTVRIGMAVVMLPLTVFYDRVSARDHDNRAFGPLILVSAGLVLALSGVQRFVDRDAGSFGLMVASPVIQAFLLAEFWNFANRYFTIRESKRVFPQLFGAASLGGVAAGFAISTLAELTSTENLLLLWLVLQALGLLFIRAIRENCEAVQTIDPTADGPRRSRSSTRHRRGLWRRVRDAVFREPLVTGIVGLSFVGTVVLFLAEYAYYDIFVGIYTDTDELTEFIGFWSAISSAINFALSMFLLPRISTLLGVRNVTLIQPVLALLVFSALLVSPVLAVGVFSYIAILSRNVVEETNEKFLYKGLAPDVAQVVRGRSEGAVKPIAAAFAALLLYLFGTADSPLMDGDAFAVSIVGVVIAVGYVFIAQVARYAYPRAIVERIRTRTFDPEDQTEVLLEGSESEALLREQLASKDAEIVRFAAEYLHAASAERATELVVERLGSAPAEMRAELLELLAEWRPSWAPLEAAVKPFLDDDDAFVRASAIRVWSGLPDADMTPVVAALDDVTDVRREAIAAMCTHWDLMLVAQGAQELDLLLQSEAEAERLAGVVVLGRLGDRRHLRMLTPFLVDDSARVRLRAARVLDERVDKSCGYLVDEIVAKLGNREPAVRLHLLDALLRIGSPRASEAVLQSGEGVPVRMRLRSARFLANYAATNLELLEATISTPGAPHGERLLAVQALTLASLKARNAHRDFLARCAHHELTEAYQTLRDGYEVRHVLRGDDAAGRSEDERDAVELLTLALEDRRREALEIVVEIVGFGSQHPEFETIRTYCFSNDPVARAYAIEALEAIADRRLFELLLPFLTVDPDDELKLALGSVGEQLALDHGVHDDVLARRVADGHPWVRACALFAATRLGHDIAPDAAMRLTNDPDPLVRETASWARERVGALTLSPPVPPPADALE